MLGVTSMPLSDEAGFGGEQFVDDGGGVGEHGQGGVDTGQVVVGEVVGGVGADARTAPDGV